MGVTVAWDDAQQTIIRLSFEAPWGAEQLRSAGVQTILLMRSVSHSVYVISDFSSSGSLPLGVFWQARELNRMSAPNWRATVAITNDSLIRNLVDIFSRIYMGPQERQSFVVKTNEEAYEIIEQLKKDNVVT